MQAVCLLSLYSVDVLRSEKEGMSSAPNDLLWGLGHWVLLILQVPPDTFLAFSAGLSWFYQASFPFCFVVWLLVTGFQPSFLR